MKSGRGLPQSKTLSRRRTHLHGSWSQCMRKNERGLSMNRKVGRAVLSPPGFGAVRTPRPTKRRGSWPQCMSGFWRCSLSMNRPWFRVPPSGGTNSSDRLKPGLQTASGSWSECMREGEWRLSMNWHVVACAMTAALSADARLRAALTRTAPGGAWRGPQAPARSWLPPSERRAAGHKDRAGPELSIACF